MNGICRRLMEKDGLYGKLLQNRTRRANRRLSAAHCIQRAVRGYLSRLHERPWLEHRRIVTGRLHLLAGWGKHGSIAADLKPWDPSCSDPVTHTPIYQQALFPTPRAGKIGRKQVPGALGFEG